MKKTLLTLAIALISMLSYTKAFAIEFEIIRTKEAPGYFLLKIFPSKNMSSFKKEAVFIKNFDTKDAEKYTEILEILEDLGHTIKDVSFLKKYPPNEDIFILGKEIYPYKSITTDEKNPFSSFEAFQKEVEKETYLKEIQISSGGNISEIHIKNENLTNETPISIIGKFEKSQKTRFEISGKTNEGIVSFSTILPLDETNRSNDPLSTYLPELWEQAQKNDKTPTRNTLTHIFPIILLVIGILFILFAIKISRKKNTHTQTSIFKDAPNTVQKSSEKKDLPIPFEIEFNTNISQKN